jgi:transcriptional regulator with XRE-family HTH domain
LGSCKCEDISITLGGEMAWDGIRIKNLRRKMNWSPEDLARRLCCTNEEVLNWESEVSIPGSTFEIKLLRLEELSLKSLENLNSDLLAEIQMKDHGLDQISQTHFVE